MGNTTVEKEEDKKKITKKVKWIYDKETSQMVVSDESILASKESQFSFKLERFKDKDTHEEGIKITNYKDDDENGVIVTSIVDLDTDIKQFRKFGVVIEPTYFRDLCKQIELVYLDITAKPIDLDKDTRIDDLITQVKEYITDYKDCISEDFCYIPVNMFNDLANDCGYCNYEMKTLRVQLSKDGFIHIVGDRYAILKRIKDKPERVVAFYREKLGVEIPVKKTKKSEETSGTDEK